MKSCSYTMAEDGAWIAILAFAYTVGGPAATAAVGVVQLAPAAIFAPFAAVLGDRYRRDRVLRTGYVAQAVAVGGVGAAILSHAPAPVIYALAAVAATSVTVTRPAQGALLPALARTVDELTAANVAAGWIESVGIMLGPLLLTTPGGAFVACAALVLAPALLPLVGDRASFVVVAAVLPALTLLAWRRLAASDTPAVAPVAHMTALRALPFFAALPVDILETLARRVTPLDAPAGSVLIREGEPGDRFYALVGGEVEVTKAGRLLARLGAGDYFGEIALLRDVPRTATVIALAPVRLLALERADFLEALTGYPQSAGAIHGVAARRLDEQHID